VAGEAGLTGDGGAWEGWVVDGGEGAKGPKRKGNKKSTQPGLGLSSVVLREPL
jgi:hypothetical protein